MDQNALSMENAMRFFRVSNLQEEIMALPWILHDLFDRQELPPEAPLLLTAPVGRVKPIESSMNGDETNDADVLGTKLSEALCIQWCILFPSRKSMARCPTHWTSSNFSTFQAGHYRTDRNPTDGES